MRRCADVADCGNDNLDSDLFCRVCALPLLGSEVGGRYMVQALISKGSYSAVFRGADQKFNRRIAIKVLLSTKTTPAEEEHFLREARIVTTLEHQSIAPILDYGKDGPCVFLVMPLYTAGSLRTRLVQANGPLPANETLNNFHQLAHTLFYAHTRPRPVIHGDIKPENLLLHQEDFRIMITDFGAAHVLEPGVRVGKTALVRGTIGYRAPEQANGVIDPRSDQFSCAVVLYEMLTGYTPFGEYGGPILPPSMISKDLPSTLDTVVLRALEASPQARFDDMLAFIQAFDNALSLYRKSMASAIKLQSYPPLRIFLCHSSGDKPMVRDLYQQLKVIGTAPWLDEEDLLPGQDWQQEIRNAMQNCDIVLICLSKHSINKVGYVQKEIKIALDVADEQPEGTIFLIPLRLEDCHIPERLKHLQCINFFEKPAFDKLMKALVLRAERLFSTD